MSDEREYLSVSSENLGASLEAQTVLQSVAQTVQQQAHDRLASVVTRCLEAVFDDPYEFQLVFDRKRGKTEARLVFARDGVEYDPGSVGGGVVDVAAFALRLSALMLVRPPPRRVLFLDEPFKMVSRNYAGRARQLLEVLSEELGLQIVQVTHNRDLVTGTVIDLSE